LSDTERTLGVTERTFSDTERTLGETRAYPWSG